MTILEQFLQRQQSSELFLWAHLSLLAVLPLALILTMAGLAVGDPLLPSWLEMPILAIPIIAYTVWQQWQRPFYPFSLGLMYQSPEYLNLRQRQILAIVKRPATGWIALFVGILLYSIFRQLYIAAPLAAAIAPFPSGWRFFGILWALTFFLVANVCAQLGVVALRILVLPASELEEEYNPQKVKEDFTLLGAPRQHLWSFTSDTTAQQAATTQSEAVIDDSEPRTATAAEEEHREAPAVTGQSQPETTPEKTTESAPMTVTVMTERSQPETISEEATVTREEQREAPAVTEESQPETTPDEPTTTAGQQKSTEPIAVVSAPSPAQQKLSPSSIESSSPDIPELVFTTETETIQPQGENLTDSDS
ncbi:MAG: low-complexity tail membrane protein [Pseudanabaenaceae cyanobacterium SKYGB_i_bin29]|nr:low-complexity tail membrane protein [Pseudanabaenaceae cyanobacterium SKYG29]MDW8422522.1 low-complexity tail membrane protein [Pseudanabaenaceae cyanobacterium SKYGB_i_bin29]